MIDKCDPIWARTTNAIRLILDKTNHSPKDIIKKDENGDISPVYIRKRLKAFVQAIPNNTETERDYEHILALSDRMLVTSVILIITQGVREV